MVFSDLALRNLLLDCSSGRNVVKVADFGLSRMTTAAENDEDESMAMYCPVKHRKPLPVRWLAPEAWYDKQFSSRSDVWAFGVTLWELFSPFASKPYSHLLEKDIMKEVANGLRLGCPEGCPATVFALMQTCWLKDATQRPTFRSLYSSLRFELDNLGKVHAKAAPKLQLEDDPYGSVLPDSPAPTAAESSDDESEDLYS